MAAAAAPVNNTNKKVIFKNCAPFINCISRTNNAQVNDAQDIDIVIPIFIQRHQKVYGNTIEMNQR